MDESSPMYREPPRPHHAQELPGSYGGHSPYTDGSPATTTSQFAAGQRNPLLYQSAEPRRTKRRICGLAPLFFAIGLVAILLIITGAVVGGVLGTRSTQNKSLR